MTYISGLFDICKKIQEENMSNELQNVLTDINNADFNFSNSSRILQAVKSEADFYGILLLNDKIKNNKTNNQLLKSINPLEKEHHKVFTIMNSIMLYFSNKCLSTLSTKSQKLKDVLNPYFKYQKDQSNNFEIDFSEEFDKSLFDEVLNDFCKIEIVKIFNQEVIKFDPLMQSIDEIAIYQLLEMVKEEISTSGFSNVPASLVDIERKVLSGEIDTESDVLRFVYLCVALQQTLILTMEIISIAFKGIQMGIIDENNLITVKSNFSNLLKKGIHLIVQPTDKAEPFVGNLALIKYTIDDHLTKEYAYCIYTSLKMYSEHGSTLECKFNLVNDELNQYNYLKFLYKI